MQCTSYRKLSPGRHYYLSKSSRKRQYLRATEKERNEVVLITPLICILKSPEHCETVTDLYLCSKYCHYTFISSS